MDFVSLYDTKSEVYFSNYDDFSEHIKPEWVDRVQDRNEMGLILCKDENGEKCLNYVGVIELEDNHMVYVSLGLSEKLLVSLMMQNSIFENNVQAIVNDNYDIC